MLNRQYPLIAILVLMLFALTSQTEAQTSQLTSHTIEHKGITRNYLQYLPQNLPGKPLPLVFVLHGGGGSAEITAARARATFEWQVLAEQEKFVVIYPNGVDNQWHDCRSDAHATLGQSDDVGFISTIIDTISRQTPIDQERIYVTGASNGGMMSYRMVFELSDRIAAIGAIVANIPVDPTQECIPLLNPTTIVIVNGTDDPLVPFNGGTVANDARRGTVTSTPMTVDYWVGFNGCNIIPKVEELPNINTNDGTTVTKFTYNDCLEGNQVVLFRVNGGGHKQPSIKHPDNSNQSGKQNQDFESVQAIWDILKNQKLGNIVLKVDEAIYKKPFLTIKGENFATGTVVMLNKQNVTSLISSQTNETIILRGSKKKLQLKVGANELVVTVDGRSSKLIFSFNN